LLERFLSSAITLEAFRAEFQQRTISEWDFGLSGMSGAMFLNKLTKYAPDVEGMVRQLKKLLPVPDYESQGRDRLTDFDNFLSSIIQRGEATKLQLQPARAPFLVSAWWHMQQSEDWPIYYQSGRKVLESEKAYKPTGNPIDDYFLFRQAFRQIAGVLQIGPWQFEHLLNWCDKKSSPAATNIDATDQELSSVIADLETEDAVELLEDGEDVDEPGTHAHIQWVLAKIGRKVGCQIWIASNDHSKSWNNEVLGNLSIDSLPPLGLDGNSQKLIRLIDVVWLKGKQIVAAFEVEHTTSIFSGLLRLSDLVALCPNLNFPLYIVAPEKRIPKVRLQLCRPTFQSLELNDRCAFFSDEKLLEKADAMLEWATEPSVVEQLASRVGDVE
jgi:hypothetical protein